MPLPQENIIKGNAGANCPCSPRLAPREPKFPRMVSKIKLRNYPNQCRCVTHLRPCSRPGFHRVTSGRASAVSESRFQIAWCCRATALHFQIREDRFRVLFRTSLVRHHDLAEAASIALALGLVTRKMASTIHHQLQPPVSLL